MSNVRGDNYAFNVCVIRKIRCYAERTKGTKYNFNGVMRLLCSFVITI